MIFLLPTSAGRGQSAKNAPRQSNRIISRPDEVYSCHLRAGDQSEHHLWQPAQSQKRHKPRLRRNSARSSRAGGASPFSACISRTLGAILTFVILATCSSPSRLDDVEEIRNAFRPCYAWRLGPSLRKCPKVMARHYGRLRATPQAGRAGF